MPKICLLVARMGAKYWSPPAFSQKLTKSNLRFCNSTDSSKVSNVPRRKRRSRKRVTSPIFPRTGTGLGDGVAEQSDKQP